MRVPPADPNVCSENNERMVVRVFESTGHVVSPDDVYVSGDVRAVFARPTASASASASSYPPGQTIALWFVSARTGERVPVPADVRVTQGHLRVEPWSPDGEFLLLVDRAYQVWGHQDQEGGDRPIFETQEAYRETHVGLSRSVASFAPHLRRMMMGQE